MSKICPICGKKLDTKKSYKEHKKEHDEQDRIQKDFAVRKPLWKYLKERKRASESFGAVIWRLIDRKKLRTDLEYELIEGELLDE